MTTVRITDEHRQAISEILEQAYAIEYSIDLFYRKGSELGFTRAQDDIETMRAAVERLRAIVACADQPRSRATKSCSASRVVFAGSG